MSKKALQIASYLLTERYNLLPTDACHIVVAQAHDVQGFATLDPDFSPVDDIVVSMP